jgi:large subunit ribosomal protein L18
MRTIHTISKRDRLKKKIRSIISGTASRPRISIYKSNKFMYAQAIDDVSSRTLTCAHDMKGGAGTKTDRARIVGTQLAENLKKIGITEVVFDRNGFKYTGRVAALADAARNAGLTF